MHRRLVLTGILAAGIGLGGLLCGRKRRRRPRPGGNGDLVFLQGEVGLPGRVPGSLSAEPLPGAEGAEGGGPVLRHPHVHAALPRRRPRGLDVRRRAGTARSDGRAGGGRGGSGSSIPIRRSSERGGSALRAARGALGRAADAASTSTRARPRNRSFRLSGSGTWQ